MRAIKIILLSVFIGGVSFLTSHESAFAASARPDSYPVESVDFDSNTLSLESTEVCPTIITFVQTIQCSINTPGSKINITFNATTGDQVRMRMLDTSGSIFYPIYWIYRPDNTEVCYATGDPLANANCALNASGTYTVLAGDSNGQHTGSFSLFLERLNNPGLPTPITFGQTNVSSITNSPQLRAFTFTASSADRILIRMLVTAGASFYPIYWIYRPDGSELCYGTGDPLSQSTCTIDLNGKHTILAGDNSGVCNGNFNLYIQRLNAPGMAAQIAYNQASFDIVSIPLEWHTY
jgi:hypothetical protein